MKLVDRYRTAKRGYADHGAVVETYPSESVHAARQMASKDGDNRAERANYARVLVRESQDLTAYISRKSDRPLKRAG